MALANGSGDIMLVFDLQVIKGTPLANTAIIKGEVLVNRNGTGFRPSVSGDHGPFFVAIEDSASAASPDDIQVLRKGVVRLTAENAVDHGEWCTTAATNQGEVDPWASPAGTPNLKQIVGQAQEDIGAGECGKVLIGY